MAEQTPNTPNTPEQQQQPPAQTKSVAEQIQDFIEENAERFKTVNKEVTDNQEVQSMKGKQDSATLNRATRDIMRIIQNNRTDPTLQRELPPLTRQILNGFTPSAMGEKNSPLIYCLIKHSQGNGQMDTVTTITSAAKDIFELRYLDPDTAKSVLNPLMARLTERGGNLNTDVTLREISNFVRPVETPLRNDEILNQQRSEYTRIRDGVMGTIDNIHLPASQRSEIEFKVRSEHRDEIANQTMSEEFLRGLIDDKIRVAEYAIKNEIRQAFYIAQDSVNRNNYRLSAETPEKASQQAAQENYINLLKQYRDRGIISEQTRLGLERSLQEIKPIIEFEQSQQSSVQSSQLELMHYAKQMMPNMSERQVKVLTALTSATELEKLVLSAKSIKTGGLLYFDDRTETVKWEIFYNDVRDIFEDVLSVVDARPKQFFQEVFSPMYEGHLYDLLLKSLTGLGDELAAKGQSSKLNKNNITYRDVIAVPNPGETTTNTSPRTEIIREKKVKTPFADAIGNRLRNDMIELLAMRENLHNVDAILFAGLGWEQLSQYSDKISTKSIDWVFHSDKDTCLAYNQYLKSLESTVSSNGRIITPQFGATDSTLNLDATERDAYYKLYAQLSTIHPDWNENLLKKRTIQKVRTAAGIAKGVTGEFWTKVMAARMPIGQTEGTDVDGHKIFQVALPYVGTNSAGYEKMIGQLDLDLMLERFGLPKLFNSMRHVWRPRKISHGAGKDAKTEYTHGNVFKWAKLDGDAFFRGRSDDLAAFDEENIFLYDNLKTNNVGMFAREGWRFTDHKALIRYNLLPGSSEPDFNSINLRETLINMQRTGTYLVKYYIDKLSPNDFAKLPPAEMLELCGVTKIDPDMSHEEKEHFKEQLYARLVFGHYSAVSPTKMIKLEMKRYTPFEEQMLKDDLLDYMRGEYSKMGISYDKEILSTHAYNMYLSAMELAESSTWNETRAGVYKKVPPYIFGVKNIEEHEAEIRTFFRQYKAIEIGEYERPQGGPIKIEENEEQFVQMVKGMTRSLRSSIDKPRWNRYDHNRKDAKQESLEQRFAHYLKEDMANIKAFVAGDDFDFGGEFYLQSAGARIGGRYMGETFTCTSKMNPALSKILMEALPTLVKGHYGDNNALEKAIEQNLIPPIKDIHAAISQMDKGQADIYTVQLMVHIARLLGKDRPFRMKGVGPVADWWWRQMFPTSQTNIMQDFFRNNYDRSTTAFDSDQLYLTVEHTLNAVNVSANEEKVDHYEDVKFLGKVVGKKRVNMGEKWVPLEINLFGKKRTLPRWMGLKRTIDHEKAIEGTVEDVMEAEKLVGKQRWIENYIPIAVIIALVGMLALMKMAADKNKKK